LEINQRAQLKKLDKRVQRSDQDRRQNHISSYKFLLFNGKRRTLQRSDDCKQVAVLDHYHPTLLLYVLIALGLSLLDATLTLILLEKGAVELNPVMLYYISLGTEMFVIVKYGLTSVALMIMVVLNPIISERYRIVASLMFPFCIVVFGSVVVWEVYLLVW